jgi:hypothetical protein
VPRKLKGTLTLNILKSMYILKYPILLSELYPVATPEHSVTLLLGNYGRVVTITPDLQAAVFNNTKELFRYSSTLNLLLLLIYIKGSYLTSKALLLS